MKKSKVKGTDTAMDVLIKLAEGNPGALSVCMQLLTEGKKIDPQAFMGGLGWLLTLDDLGIYGPRIWMLFKDVSKQDLELMLAVLRANQLGMISKHELNHAIDNRGDGIDLDQILINVKERLEHFGDRAK